MPLVLKEGFDDSQITFTVSKAGERSVRSALASCGGQRAEVDVSDFEVSALGVIAALVKRAENAERKEREWADEWRKACKRAQEAERERDSVFSSVPTPRMNADAARIAQLEAALRRIAEKRGVAKEDAKRYLEGACDIADDALRPVEPKGE